MKVIEFFFIDSTLSLAEATRFAEAYSREVPSKKSVLKALEKDTRTLYRNPFYFALVAFEKDFTSLDKYVQQRINKTTDIQREILTFIALAYHYAHRPLPLQIFANLIGLSPTSVIRFEDIFSEPIAELLIYEDLRLCRPIHELVALEIIEQVLSKEAVDRRIWTQSLSLWAKNFASLCSHSDRTISDEVKDLLIRLFIYREQKELEGETSHLNNDMLFSLRIFQAMKGGSRFLSFLQNYSQMNPTFGRITVDF